MSVLERVKSIRGGIELPFWDGVKFWVSTRPKPVYLPRLPKRLMTDESISWIKNRPKMVKR